MNAMTPTETERNILEFMCDPDRPRQLLAQVKDAEVAVARANAAKAEADRAYKLAADTLAAARQVEQINASKAQVLIAEAADLKAAVQEAARAKADDVARLTEWENRLKAREAELDARAAAQSEVDARLTQWERALAADTAAAQAIIDRAERIKAASEA